MSPKRASLPPAAGGISSRTSLFSSCPAAATVTLRPEPGFDLDAACPGRLAIADPDHVPAGIYARAALEHLGWWTSARDRLVATGDVRAALRLVEMGEVDGGVVYGTDAASSPRVERVATFPPESHPPILYPVALRRDAAPGAEAFLAYLARPETVERFESFGFRVPSE